MLYFTERVEIALAQVNETSSTYESRMQEFTASVQTATDHVNLTALQVMWSRIQNGGFYY